MKRKFIYKIQLRKISSSRIARIYLKIEKFADISAEDISSEEEDVTKLFFFITDGVEIEKLLPSFKKDIDRSKNSISILKNFFEKDLNYENDLEHIFSHHTIRSFRNFTEELCNLFLLNHYIYNMNGDKNTKLEKFKVDTFQEYLFYKPYIS